MKIELKDINKKYGKDFQIEHLNMTIESEKFITFLGKARYIVVMILLCILWGGPRMLARKIDGW